MMEHPGDYLRNLDTAAFRRETPVMVYLFHLFYFILFFLKKKNIYIIWISPPSFGERCRSVTERSEIPRWGTIDPLGYLHMCFLVQINALFFFIYFFFYPGLLFTHEWKVLPHRGEHLS